MQVSADIEALKKTISDLQEAVKSAKARQEETKAEIKKLEKDIDEFKNNKEGKIDPSEGIGGGTGRGWDTGARHDTEVKVVEKEWWAVVSGNPSIVIACA